MASYDQRSSNCYDNSNSTVAVDLDSIYVKTDFAEISNKETADLSKIKLSSDRIKFVSSIAIILSLISVACSLGSLISVSNLSLDDNLTISQELDQNFLIGYLNYTPQESCQMLGQNMKYQGIPNKDGIYYLKDAAGILYPAYCDMTTDNGGWTLVASIHENNLGDNGRCTLGDKWSGEQGNKMLSEDSNWKNLKIFGHVVSATSEDYKNQAYFELKARDIMIWQVPNNSPSKEFKSSALLRYRTTNGFMFKYGNLLQLFSDKSLIQNENHTKCSEGNGPSSKVIYDLGNESITLSQYGPAVHQEIEAGYLQFHATRPTQESYAMCMGVKPLDGACNPQHYCVGSSGNTLSKENCGDFSSFDADGFGTNEGRSADKHLIESVFMIFYR